MLHTTDERPTVIGADWVVGHLAHLESCTIGDGVLVSRTRSS